jgi:uncharacterized repeat protein (TIGR04138 family)
MLCNECNQRPAKFTITQSTGAKKRRRYLCALCAQSVNFTPTPAVLSGEMWQYMKADPLLDIVASDSRYAIDAYYFILDACERISLDQIRSSANLRQILHGASTHVSNADLLQVLRRDALDTFGVTAKPVLNSWGIFACEDFGEIVFNMIAQGLLGAGPDDTKDNFRGGYDFDRAFPGPAR